jgi:hypothetical protein
MVSPFAAAGFQRTLQNGVHQSIAIISEDLYISGSVSIEKSTVKLFGTTPPPNFDQDRGTPVCNSKPPLFACLYFGFYPSAIPRANPITK